MQKINNNEQIALTHLEAILETAVDAIITINSSGLIDIFNPAAERLFGYSADEAKGKNVNILMPEPFHAEHDSYLKHYEATKDKNIIGTGREVLAKQRSGRIFPIYLSIGEAVIDGESVYVGFIHDISVRKQQEGELIRHRNHLQTMVDKKTKELSIAIEKLQILANIDDLTNLANRRIFDETLRKEIMRAIRRKTPLTLMLCDIDYFKQFNDVYGHLAGDECLMKFAECLKDSFKRASDMPARYGGEEFAVILPHTDSKEAINLNNAFIENLRKLAIPHSQSDVSNHITISTGIITIIPDKTVDANTLIHAADEALYKAKKNGRNRTEIASLD
jgi:diguanylate cyclase (GGDEF)-like protein/PAS domain S-box-containing protein